MPHTIPFPDMITAAKDGTKIKARHVPKHDTVFALYRAAPKLSRPFKELLEIVTNKMTLLDSEGRKSAWRSAWPIHRGDQLGCEIAIIAKAVSASLTLKPHYTVVKTGHRTS
jgi:hypothetical protein